MTKNMRRYIACLMIMSFPLLFGITEGWSMEVDKTKWPQRIVIGGSVVGGPDYAIANGISNILTEKLKLNSVVQATAGTTGATRLVDSDQCELAVSAAGLLQEALKGTGWTKGRKYPNPRLLFMTYPKWAHFWAPVKTGIKKITDLNGKRVNLSSAGSTADIIGRRLFEILAIKPGKITNVPHGDANNLIKDNLLDAAFTVGLLPQTGVAELSLTDEISVIGLREDEIKKVMDREPYLTRAMIPKGTYKGVDYDVSTINEMSCIITTKKVPDDFAYMITKTVMENLPALVNFHKGTKSMNLENINLARSPLHKGAYLYYKEKGLTVPKEGMPVD